MAEKLWGKAAELCTGVALLEGTLVLAAVSGAASAASGGKFSDGWDQAFDGLEHIASKAGAFGDRHSDDLTKTSIRVAGSVLGHEISNGLDHH